MRRAQSVSFLGDEDSIQGVVLEGGYCSEHEHGIRGLMAILGIQTSPATGIEQRSMQGALDRPDYLNIFETTVKERFYKRKGKVGNISKTTSPVTVMSIQAPIFDNGVSAEKAILSEVGERYTEEQEAIAVWDDGGFIIAAFSDRARKGLTELAESLKVGDFAAWTGRLVDNPFAAAGLVLCAPSRVPLHNKQAMLDADNDRNALQDAAKATGIVDRLKQANAEVNGGAIRFWGPLSYHALSPKWVAGGDREKDTEHSVVFFLNPSDQKSNNYGWFTVEELDAWIAGEGPIPKEPKPTPTMRP